jgi:hypothetical protein
MNIEHRADLFDGMMKFVTVRDLLQDEDSALLLTLTSWAGTGQVGRAVTSISRIQKDGHD